MGVSTTGRSANRNWRGQNESTIIFTVFTEILTFDESEHHAFELNLLSS